VTLTPDQRSAIRALVVVPGRATTGSPADVLDQFGTADGRALGLALLRDAVDRQDGSDTELALIVCYTFGFTPDHLDLLVRLTSADWHHKHEDVVRALGKLRSPAAVDALQEMAQRVPDYLDFDENRGLAVKAIRALGDTPGPEAEQALTALLGSDSEVVRDAARQQLDRRAS
jgi:HEAT repeat protein